ncbi:hypothetical protein [Bradyrhizobium sp. Leo121]|uniref:hypothetical protein n=1 Tax=Bradyrhizobium sp. Leo121 TaxID=1571195 RepID=UPI0013EEFEDF|nr:hypothetical protein [Bradyrhizobium sp. Leo121]
MSMKTRLYLRFAARINMVLRPLGLLLMATFEGDPPEPVEVVRLHLRRSGRLYRY